jgi:hypothetical protein
MDQLSALTNEMQLPTCAVSSVSATLDVSPGSIGTIVGR